MKSTEIHTITSQHPIHPDSKARLEALLRLRRNCIRLLHKLHAANKEA